jgi:hypothetical protein
MDESTNVRPRKQPHRLSSAAERLFVLLLLVIAKPSHTFHELLRRAHVLRRVVNALASATYLQGDFVTHV